MKKHLKSIPILILVCCFSIILGNEAKAQSKKLDLDDFDIKGEVHNDNQLSIMSRQKNELKNFIKYRKNYRQEILQQLPEERDKKRF